MAHGSVEIRQRSSRPRKRPLTTCNANDIDVSSIDLTDLSHLKEVSQRLNLSTRRPSTVEWKQVIELRKSMGLYGSSGDVTGIVGQIAEARGDIQVGNFVDDKPSPLIQNKSTFELDGIPNGCKTKTKSRSSKDASTKAPTQNHANSKKKSFSILSLKLMKSKNEHKEFISNDERQNDPKTQSEKIISNDTHFAVSPKSLSAKIEKCEDQRENIRLFCDTDDDFETDYASRISEASFRYYNVTRALRKIRRDLITMRMEDNRLARDLLETRSQMNILRLTQSCDEHAEMLDDVAYEMEEEDMLTGLIKACDLPSRPPGSLLSAFSPLRNIGVSRMNLNRRRFSIR